MNQIPDSFNAFRIHNDAEGYHPGVEAVTLDDLSEGHEPALQGAELCRGSTLDRAFLAQVFADHPIRAVCHFAARPWFSTSNTISH